MANLQDYSIESKSLGEIHPFEGNQQNNPEHSHTGTNVEIFTVHGVKSVYLNRRKAIRLKCHDCSGYERNEVRDCSCTDCSLYPFRSGRGKQNPEERDKAIRAYCMWCTLDQPREISLRGSVGCPLYQFRGYNRVKKKPDSTKEGSNRDFRRHDHSSLIPEPHPRANTQNERLYMNNKNLIIENKK